MSWRSFSDSFVIVNRKLRDFDRVDLDSATIQSRDISPSMKVLRRVLFLAAYFGWVRHSMTRTVRTRSLGFHLTIPPTVFHPRYYFTSKFFGDYISTLQLSGKNVLDIGCGSGILSLAAARSGGRVIAVDINPAAVQATEINARRNGLHETIQAVESDLFAGLDHSESKFDYILCNPPFYDGEPRTMTEKAFRGGNGMTFMARLARFGPSFLSPGGAILLVLSSDADLRACLIPFEVHRFEAHVVKVTKLLFETLSIVELRRS
jgi:release factor glutamine methyltransferase